MRKDRLEKFIIVNKEELSNKKAPADLWDKINQNLYAPQETQRPSPWKNVSIILLLIVTLLFVLMWFQWGSDSNELPDIIQPLEFAELEDFKETEHFYLSSINVSYDKLTRFEIDATLEEELRLLDKNSQELMEEYKVTQGAYKEQVLRALILNYKTKLQILENVLYTQESNSVKNIERTF